MEKVTVYIDGGSRGNPGPAAAAFVLTAPGGGRISAKGFFLGSATNNVAEYTGLLKALEEARQIGAERLDIFSDSELLVKQIKGQYRVKSEHLKPLYNRAADLLQNFEHVRLQHIPREKNTQADGLVNQALDLKKDVEAKCLANQTSKKPIRLGVLISGGGNDPAIHWDLVKDMSKAKIILAGKIVQENTEWKI